jgi:hypothetical protein
VSLCQLIPSFMVPVPLQYQPGPRLDACPGGRRSPGTNGRIDPENCTQINALEMPRRRHSIQKTEDG